MSTTVIESPQTISDDAELAGVESANARPPESRESRRVPALDGIRGIAILGVLGFHFRAIGWPKPLALVAEFATTWGWTGVELFFVLSGYLITGILYDANGSQSYFRGFYGRRALRIFPPYFLLLTILFVVMPTFAPQLTKDLGFHSHSRAWVYWTYMSDLASRMHISDYQPLVHIWSLAVEEKFYLVWPALVWFLSRRWLIRFCIAVAIVLLVARITMIATGSSLRMIHDAAFMRADSLLIGALVALLSRSPDVWPFVRRYALAAAGATLVIGLTIFFWKRHAILLASDLPTKVYHRNMEMGIRYSWISFFFACILTISVAAPDRSLFNRVLSIRPLRFFGRYSYGMYLYFWPLMVLTKSKIIMPDPRDWRGTLTRCVGFPVALIAVSLLSWHAMEKHFLKLKRYFPM